MNPLAQRFGAEAAQQRGDLRGPFGIAREERRVGFGVGDVHAADAGQEEFSPHRRHAVVQVDLDPGLAQHFSRHQAGGAAADDGDVRGEGVGVWVMACAAVWRKKAGILAAQTLWSGLARDGGRCQSPKRVKCGLIAGKLAPTGLMVFERLVKK